jgi:hypothetical protein
LIRSSRTLMNGVLPLCRPWLVAAFGRMRLRARGGGLGKPRR